MGTVVGLIIGAVIGILFAGLVIWIVGKLGWGMEVAGFGPAFLAALVVGILNAIVSAIFAALGIPAISVPVQILLTAGYLYYAGSRIKGLTVKGFGGALIASLAIAVINWLIALLLGGLV